MSSMPWLRSMILPPCMRVNICCSNSKSPVVNVACNLSNEPFVINPGERIAQMVVARYEKVEWDEVEVLDETERGEGGFGSTGRK